MDVNNLKQVLRDFAAERDWNKFHTPKNLAMAVATEAGELLAEFQWLTAEESASLAPEKLERVRLELADVTMHVIRLADVLKIDLEKAVRDKVSINAKRYPVEKSRGNARKYTEL